MDRSLTAAQFNAGLVADAAGAVTGGGSGGSSGGGGGAGGGSGVLDDLTPTQVRKIRSDLETLLRNPRVPDLSARGGFNSLRLSRFVEPNEMIASLVEDFGVTKAQARELMKTSQYWDSYRKQLARRRG